MDITNPKLQEYAESHTTPETSLLKRINQETYAEVPMPRMLSGHLQGRLLSMLSRMIRPKTILEIGTYTGYSGICLAEGLAAGGRLITIDINSNLEKRVRKYFEDSGMSSRIDFLVGDAREIITKLPGPFDLTWIDADKINYALYYDLVIDKVPSGGFVLADNVLWSGKVVEVKQDKDTRAIIDFNKKLFSDPRIEVVLLPVRDGVMLARKK